MSTPAEMHSSSPIPINLEAEIDTADETAARLARFGNHAGQHGSLAQARVAMTLRLPREVNLDLIRLASEVGPRPTTLMTEVALIASKCRPSNWHAALLAFQRISERGTRAGWGSRSQADR